MRDTPTKDCPLIPVKRDFKERPSIPTKYIGGDKLSQIEENEYKKIINDIKKLLDEICLDDRVKYHINPVVEEANKML